MKVQKQVAAGHIINVVCEKCGHKGAIFLFIGIANKKDWDKYIKEQERDKK